MKDRREQEADSLAEEALIPRNKVDKSLFSERLSSADVEALAQIIKIHPAVVAGRIRFENKNYRLLSKYVGNREVRKHFQEQFYRS
jgi:HTH-type transcriptional regulator/antitoxin HigA